MRLRGKAGANSLSHTHELRSLSYGYRVAWLAQITRHARYNERYGVPTAYRPLHTDKGIFKSAPNEPHTGIESIQRIEVPLDPDLAEQAVVGHGVPSQDPSGAAQVSLAPEEAKREAKSALVGGGVMAGLLAGVAAGAVLGGPIGVLVGGTVGTIASALGGEAVGQIQNPEPTPPLPPSAPSASEERPADS